MKNGDDAAAQDEAASTENVEEAEEGDIEEPEEAKSARTIREQLPVREDRKPPKVSPHSHLGMPSNIDDLFKKTSSPKKSAPSQPPETTQNHAPIDSSDPVLIRAATEYQATKLQRLNSAAAKESLIRRLSDRAKRIGATTTNNEPIESFPRKLLRRRLSRSQRLELYAATTKEEPSLRDFKQGRYEDVIAGFDTRKARKMGIHVPEDFDDRVKDKRKKVERRKKRSDDRKAAESQEESNFEPAAPTPRRPTRFTKTIVRR